MEFLLSTPPFFTPGSSLAVLAASKPDIFPAAPPYLTDFIFYDKNPISLPLLLGGRNEEASPPPAPALARLLYDWQRGQKMPIINFEFYRKFLRCRRRREILYPRPRGRLKFPVGRRHRGVSQSDPFKVVTYTLGLHLALRNRSP